MTSKKKYPNKTTRKVKETVFYIVSGFSIIQEIDEHGEHRIHVRYQTSNWQPYTDILLVHTNSKVFASTTDHYAGVLPRVFEIIPPSAIQPQKNEEPDSTESDAIDRSKQ